MNISVHLKYGKALRTGNDSFIHWVGADTEESQENDEQQQQQVKRRDTKKFTWKIANFSTLTETEVYSDPFVVGGHNWRVNVYPEGEEDGDDLSVYLEFADKETMASGWSVPADYSLALVNQLCETSTVKRINSVKTSAADITRNFQELHASWGWQSFAPIKGLCTKGFLVNDTLVIEAQVSTEAIASEAATDDTDSSSSASSVQSTTRSLTTTIEGISCSTKPRERLNTLFDMSLESLCQTKLLDSVAPIAQEILSLATDPLQKTVLEDLISRLSEFNDTVPSSLSTIETSLAIETSTKKMAKDLDERLAYRKGQLASLEAEASRLGEQVSKLDDEIHQLTDRRAKILEHAENTAIELEKAKQEACRELDEQKKYHSQMKDAGEKRIRAMEKLAQANASWKLFKSLVFDGSLMEPI
ncbi:Ubiquitin C-terminal hydrolase 12 [Linum grandiflorum]